MLIWRICQESVLIRIDTPKKNSKWLFSTNLSRNDNGNINYIYEELFDIQKVNFLTIYTKFNTMENPKDTKKMQSRKRILSFDALQSFFFDDFTISLIFEILPDFHSDKQLFQLQASRCTAKNVLIWGVQESYSDDLSSPSLEQHWNTRNQKLRPKETDKINTFTAQTDWKKEKQKHRYPPKPRRKVVFGNHCRFTMWLFALDISRKGPWPAWFSARYT